jgi:(R,R)-butanediol dehydrogenase/meso-butanediol dehydrogenase/diacetyl reductase
MKAMVYYGNKDLRLEEVQDPVPLAGEVKLRVDYCGICATDIEEYSYGPLFINHKKPHPLTGKMMPLITGHEVTGTVVEISPDVKSIQVGDRTVLDGIISCKECWWCSNGHPTQCNKMATVGFNRDGGLAEFLTWPASKVVKLPDNISSLAASLCEPTAVACHAIHRAHIKLGQSVAIIGAGTVGLLALQIAKSLGARVYAIDRRQISLDIAEELGADSIVNVEKTDPVQAIRKLTGGLGPDIVIETAGVPETPSLAVNMARTGGKVVVVAIFTTKPQFDFNSIVAREIHVLGTIGYTREDVENGVDLISKGKVLTLPLVSNVIGLHQVIDVGFTQMLAQTKNVFRIIVDPSM